MTTTTKPKEDEAPVADEEAPQLYPDEAKRLADLEAQREAERERNANFIDPEVEGAKQAAVLAAEQEVRQEIADRAAKQVADDEKSSASAEGSGKDK